MVGDRPLGLLILLGIKRLMPDVHYNSGDVAVIEQMSRLD